MKYSVLALIIFSILGSCIKKRTIQGKVTNPLTNKPVVGVYLAIKKKKFCLDYNGCGKKTIDNSITNENGNYALKYRNLRGHYIDIGHGEKHSLLTFDSSLGGSIGIGGNIKRDYLVVTKGYVNIKIKNTNCFDDDDLLRIKHKYHELKKYRDTYDYNSYHDITYDGCVDYSSSTNYDYVDMGWRYYEGTITRNGITSPFLDSIYVPDGDSVVWNINY